MTGWWAAAAWIGAWIGTAASVPVHPGVAACATATGTAMVGGALRRTGPRRAVLAAVGVGVALAGMSGARTAALERGPVAAAAARGDVVTVAARAVEDPRRTGDGWWTVIRVERVDGRPARARAVLGGRGRPPARGVRLQGAVRLRPLDRGSPLRRRHVGAVVSSGSLAQVGGPGALERAAARVRARIRAAAGAGLPAPLAALATGMVTGDDAALPAALQRDLRASGLGHLTAVSGANVAVLLLGVGALTASAGWAAGARRALAVAAVGALVVVTRAEPSVVRATAMALAVLAAEARGHARDGAHALAAATLVLLLVDPLLARSVGFGLSVAATAGILVVGPRLRRRLPARPRRVFDLVAATCGATLAVTPLLVAAFGESPTAAIPANLVAAPLAAAAFAVATAGGVVAQASVAAGSVVLALAAPPLQGIAAVARVAAELRLPVLSPARPAMLWAVAAAAAALAARPAARRVAVVLAVLGVAVAAAPTRPAGLVVTAVDVGQGDAVLVESPDLRVLVDAGRDGAAAAWLRRHGVAHLDLVVISHTDADHVGGLRDVLAATDVGVVWAPPGADVADDVAGAPGAVVHRPAAGHRVSTGATILEVLGPPPGRPYEATDSAVNDGSLVVRVGWRGRTALLTGDVEQAAQRDLLRRPEGVAAGLLKVPHHGGDTNAPGFLAAVGATVAIICVGDGNPYGHPAPDVLDDLRAAGTGIRRTDLEGDVRVEVPVRGVEVGRAAATPPAPVVDDPRRAAPARLACRHVRSAPPRRPAARRRRRAARAPSRGAADRDPGTRARPGADVPRRR